MLERPPLARAWFSCCVPSAVPCWPRVPLFSKGVSPCPAELPWGNILPIHVMVNTWQLLTLTQLREFAHLPLMKASLAKLRSSPHAQPSPGCSFVPSLRRIFGAADLDACVNEWQDIFACSRDNFALSSFSSLHSLLYLSLCGILGAICGCLAPPAVEGEYCPWDRELLQGQWLQHLSKEEEMGTCEGTRFASWPYPPQLPRSHLKYASKSRPHMEGLFCKAVSKALGIPGHLSLSRPTPEHRLIM